MKKFKDQLNPSESSPLSNNQITVPSPLSGTEQHFFDTLSTDDAIMVDPSASGAYSELPPGKFVEPQQQQQAKPSRLGGVIKSMWKQQVGAAKVVWGKLTDDEILQTEGNLEKLSGLVQERYAVNRYEADQQVRRFLRQS